jgi:hypothetical protein
MRTLFIVSLVAFLASAVKRDNPSQSGAAHKSGPFAKLKARKTPESEVVADSAEQPDSEPLDSYLDEFSEFVDADVYTEEEYQIEMAKMSEIYDQ